MLVRKDLVRANQRILTDGFYAEVSLEYDPVVAQERNSKGRAAFSTDEWCDFLSLSIGLEPTALDERAKPAPASSGSRWPWPPAKGLEES